MANYKKLITLLLIFSIHMMPFNSAYATTVGGWTIGGLVADGASSVVNASKTIVVNGANVVKTSTARITPKVGAVSKVLARGAAGYALSIAVEQLLGSVDWVLDPANNRITYYENTSDCTTLQTCNTFPKVYEFSTPQGIRYYPTLVQGCQALANSGGHWANYTYYSSHIVNSDVGQCNYRHKDYPDLRNMDTSYQAVKVNNPAYNPEAEREQKTLPLDVVAAQVITNADSHTDSDKKAGSQVATTTAAQDLLNNDSATQSDVENQLNTNARTNTAEGANEATGETKPNVADPTKTDFSLNFPAFCGWAPTICEAAQAAINFPQTVANWWSKAVLSFTEAYAFAKTKVSELEDIFKNEPSENTEIEFNDPTNDATDTNITFSRQCPAPIVLADFSYHGISQNWQVDFTGWCNVFSSIFKPIVIAMASFSAVLIVSGVRENG